MEEQFEAIHTSTPLFVVRSFSGLLLSSYPLYLLFLIAWAYCPSLPSKTDRFAKLSESSSQEIFDACSKDMRFRIYPSIDLYISNFIQQKYFLRYLPGRLLEFIVFPKMEPRSFLQTTNQYHCILSSADSVDFLTFVTHSYLELHDNYF